MLKLLAFLWSGCWHDWEEVGSGVVYSNGRDLPSGRWQERKCSKCLKRDYRQMF